MSGQPSTTPTFSTRPQTLDQIGASALAAGIPTCYLELNDRALHPVYIYMPKDEFSHALGNMERYLRVALDWSAENIQKKLRSIQKWRLQCRKRPQVQQQIQIFTDLSIQALQDAQVSPKANSTPTTSASSPSSLENLSDLGNAKYWSHKALHQWAQEVAEETYDELQEAQSLGTTDEDPIVQSENIEKLTSHMHSKWYLSLFHKTEQVHNEWKEIKWPSMRYRMESGDLSVYEQLLGEVSEYGDDAWNEFVRW